MTYEISAKQRLLGDLIQSDLQDGLSTNTITPSPPVAVNQANRNTKITINVHKGMELVNCLSSFINREFLTDILTPLNVNEMDISGYATTHDLLDDLFLQYNVKFDPEDIVLETLSSNGNMLRASPNSYGWLGTFEFTSIILEFPPLIRTTANRLLSSYSGKYLRRVYPTYPSGV